MTYWQWVKNELFSSELLTFIGIVGGAVSIMAGIILGLALSPYYFLLLLLIIPSSLLVMYSDYKKQYPKL